MARKINVGDKVRMTGAFLRSTGQIAGGDGPKRWIVKAIDERLGWAIVDEPANTSWYTMAEMEADPSLRWRRINVANLEVCP